MSTGFRFVQWNRAKIIYDTVLLAGVIFYIAVCMILGRWWFSPADNPAAWEDLWIRAFGTCAFLMLTIILSIGPLARLNPRLFLPLLYNRRHLGVLTFFVAVTHGWLNIDWFLSRGQGTVLVSILTNWSNYASVTRFPFQTLGLIAIAILFVLAATSHDFWLEKLTPRLWKTLHMAVYIAYALLMMHIALGVMQAQRSPIIPVLLGAAVAIVCSLHLFAGWRERAIDKGSAVSSDGWIIVGSPRSIPDRAARIVAARNGERIAVFRDGDRIGALTNLCAHQNGPLGEGRIIDGCVTCPWHGFQYHLEDGCAPAPFTDRITTYRVRIKRGRIEVDPAPLPLGTRVTLAQWRDNVAA